MQDSFIYKREKRIPKGWSHAFKKNEVVSILRESEIIDQIWTLGFHVGQRSTQQQNRLRVARCSFYPEGRSGFATGLVAIYFYVVPSDRRQQIREVLLSNGLSLICNWIARAKASGSSWRALDHDLEILLDTADQLALLEDGRILVKGR